MSDKIKWRKKGGGTFRMGNGKIIKGGQSFWATPEEIPLGLRHFIVPVSGEISKEPPVVPVVKYSLQSRGSGWFDVIETVSEKALNENALRKADGEKLLLELA